MELGSAPTPRGTDRRRTGKPIARSGRKAMGLPPGVCQAAEASGPARAGPRWRRMRLDTRVVCYLASRRCPRPRGKRDRSDFVAPSPSHLGRKVHETPDTKARHDDASRGHGRAGRRVFGGADRNDRLRRGYRLFGRGPHATPGGGRLGGPGRRGQLEPLAKPDGGRGPTVRRRQSGRRQSRSNSMPATCNSAPGTPIPAPSRPPRRARWGRPSR